MEQEYDKAMDEFNRKLASSSASTSNQLPDFSGNSPMASSFRDTQKRDGVSFMDPQKPVLTVTPLNSIPYTGSPISISDDSLSPTEKETDPAVVFLPCRPTEKEWNNVIAATKMGVGLTGSAAKGKVGPIIGLLDLGECEDTYLFRVSLPGVATNENVFSCEIEPSGKVVIKGVTSTGGRIVHRHSQVFEMRTQNLCPPGHFSVSFKLPGPVVRQQLAGSFGVDGILEGIVKKRPKTGL